MEDLLRECLGFRVGSAWRRLDRHFNRAFLKLGLTHAHGYVLACLLPEGELRVGEIARRTGFESSTVSRLVKELARRKLVRRRKDPEDGRSHLLRAAERARTLQPEIERVLRLADGRVRRELTEDDLAGLLHATEVMDRLP